MKFGKKLSSIQRLLNLQTSYRKTNECKHLSIAVSKSNRLMAFDLI